MVQTVILEIYSMYAPTQSPSNATSNSSTPTTQKIDENSFWFLQYMNGSSAFRMMHLAPSWTLNLRKKEIGITDDQHFYIIDWWKMNKYRFPTLSKVSKVVLMAPATSVASESALSTRQRMLDDDQFCLKGEGVETLLGAEDWIRVHQNWKIVAFFLCTLLVKSCLDFNSFIFSFPTFFLSSCGLQAARRLPAKQPGSPPVFWLC